MSSALIMQDRDQDFYGNLFLWLTACGMWLHSGGCRGGTIDLVFDFAKQQGMFLEADYPYTGLDNGRCGILDSTADTDARPEPVAILQDFVDLPENDFEATMNAVAQRPIPINVDASDFGFYSSGVFDASHCGTGKRLQEGARLQGLTDRYAALSCHFDP